MALESSLKIRVAPQIAGHVPPFCSSCFQQQFDKKHVDYSVAWDGGTLRDAGGTLITIDDLILCEDCVRIGADVIAHDPDSKIGEELKVAKERALEQKRLRLDSEKRIKELEGELSNYRNKE